MATLFDKESSHYDRAHDDPLGFSLRGRIAAVLDLLGDGPGEVLDAGMGPGRLCAELERRGWTATGVDISEQMVELAAERLPHARHRLLQSSIHELGFADASFDAVVATGVLEYLEDPAAGLRELSRVLRPGGTAVVSIGNQRSVQAVWQDYIWYPVVRGLKRALPNMRRPAPYRRPITLRVASLERMMADACLRPVSACHASVAVIPAPLDQALPGLARRLAERLEPPSTPLARSFATQVVLVGRKSGVLPQSKEPGV